MPTYATELDADLGEAVLLRRLIALQIPGLLRNRVPAAQICRSTRNALPAVETTHATSSLSTPDDVSSLLDGNIGLTVQFVDEGRR
jgi:hypothetical protein